MKKLLKTEIALVEARIDEALRAAKLPGTTRADARYLLVTACEDMLRLIFVRAASYWATESDLEERANEIHRLDEVKYNLRIGLLKVDDEKPLGPWTEGHFFRGNDKRYLDIADFLYSYAKFHMRAKGIFSSIHGEDSDAWGNARGSKIFMKPPLRSMQYRLVEALVVEDMDPFIPIPLLAASFLEKDFVFPDGSILEQGEDFKKTINSVKVRNGVVSYPFVADRLRSLVSSHLYEPQIIPPDWHFPWGNIEFSIRFFSCLNAMCHLHLVAVYLGSVKKGLQGGGLDQACLFLRKKEFVRRISLVSELEPDRVERTIDILTYGNLVNFPDLALQPFLPIQGDLLMVAPLHTVSANWPRNSLALHARIASPTFDDQSHWFEGRMIEKLSGSIPNRLVHFENRHLKVGRRHEEVDLILIDNENKFILIAECKWSIPPGDPREVQTRRKSMKQKTGQADRKLEFILKNIDVLAPKLGMHSSDYTCAAVVLTEGFGGETSTLRHIPCVPSVVFREALLRVENLGAVYRVLRSPLWLPRPGIDCEARAEIHKLGELELGDLGLGFTSNAYLSENVGRYISDAENYSDAEIDAIEW